MKTFFKFFLILLVLFGVERFCRWKTDGFRVQKVYGETCTGSIEALPDNVKQLLASSYTYLGSGVQSYVFVSADGQTVLKLFKHYHMPPRTEFLEMLPCATKICEERKKRINAIYASHQLAFEELKEDTAIIHVQLHPSDAPLLTLYDKIGVRHEIDLSRAPFVLQKRATLVFDNLKNAPDAKEKIDSLIQVIHHRWDKGISNSDPIIHRNFGFLGSKAVEIDAGSFTKSAYARDRKKELYYETLELQEWLKVHSPELFNYLEQKIFYETH